MSLTVTRIGAYIEGGPSWPENVPRAARGTRPSGTQRASPSRRRVAVALLGHAAVLAAVIWLSQITPDEPGQPDATPLSMVFEAPPAPAAPQAVPQPAPPPTKPPPPAQSQPSPPQPSPPQPAQAAVAQPAPPLPSAQTAPANPVQQPVPLPRRVPPKTEPVPQPAPAPVLALPLPPVPPEHAPAPRSVPLPPSVAVARPAAAEASGITRSAAPSALARASQAAVPARAAAPLVPPHPVAGMESDRAPAYPALARRRGEQGRVVLQVEVSPAGRPLRIAVGRSSGFSVLDDAAQDAVRDWRFVPATQDGQPVAAIALIPIQFRLTE